MAQKKIRITAQPVVMDAELNDSQTAEQTWDALPITASGSTWGDEIYFSIPVDAQPENGQELVELGDLGYWPPGTVFCIFFGPTPVSQGDEIRPASAVNVFGKLVGDATAFKKVKSGTEIKIEQID